MIPVFFSYAHEDDAYRQDLETSLELLRRNKMIDGWSDRKIAPGSNWEEDINVNLAAAKIILLLLSSDFIASDYCYETETIFAIEQAEKGLAKVVPIIIRPCLWTKSNLKKFQALPTGGKAISTWDNKDEAWLDVAEGIWKIAEELQQQPVENNTQVKTSSFKEIASRSIEDLTRGVTHSKEPLPELVTSFFNDYNQWYFSPKRINKWGGKQMGYKELKGYSTADIKSTLEDLKNAGIVKVKSSQLGNPIYKLK